MLENSSTEIVGELTCCVWRPHIDPPPTPKSEFGWKFFAVVGGSLLLVLAITKLALWCFANGNIQMGGILGISIPLLAYAGMAGAALRQRRNMRREDPNVLPPSPPPGIPRGAVPTVAVARSAAGWRGRSYGWLWVEGPWLRFAGDRFDFRLQPSDFRPSHRAWLKWILRKPASFILDLPKASPSVSVAFAAAYYVEDRQYSPGHLIDSMAPEIEAWATTSGTNSPSLYPPLSPPPGPEPQDLYPARKWLPIATLVGLVTASAAFLRPTENVGQVVGLFFAGFGLFAMIFLMPWLAAGSARRKGK